MFAAGKPSLASAISRATVAVSPIASIDSSAKRARKSDASASPIRVIVRHRSV